MRIVLTQDLNKQRGWTKGRVLEWERPTISAVSRNMGHQEWFVYADELDASSHRAALRASRSKER